MTVYVVECGVYETSVEGVYSSLERAMAAHPGAWRREQDGVTTQRSWVNGLDWQEHMSIEEYELDKPSETVDQ